MVHPVFRVLKMVAFLWAAISALLAIFAWLWVRERYGRGGPFPAKDALSLLNPMRGRLQPIESTLRAFRVREGRTVLELGPGPGYFTIGASSAVGSNGRVICVDVQQAMLSILRERLQDAQIANARLVTGDAVRLPLADGCVDAAFLVTVLGEIPDRPRALAELRRVMKAGGVLSVVETFTDCDYQLEDSVRDLCRAFGFEVIDHERRRLGYTLCFAAPGPA
jgi:ubiquinone/menaquinone biosynthesis C-methylase UbiE